VLKSSLTNFGPVAAQVLKDEPEGVLIWLDPPRAGRMAQSLRSAGFVGKRAGPGRCDSPAFLASAAQASEGFILPAIALDESGQARLDSFRAAFQERFGVAADVTAAEGYDAAMLLAHLIATNEPRSLARAFPPTSSFPGVSGDLSFDTGGNRKVALRLMVFRKGRFVPSERD
jgi:ABC-type branched-subunit amino acid transport system substrate-binding protein